MNVSIVDFLISVLEPETNELPAVFMQERFKRPNSNESHVNNRFAAAAPEPASSYQRREPKNRTSALKYN